jgi:hypothetical protein
MNVTMDRMAGAIAGEFSEIDTGTRTALAFLQQADQSAALVLLNRYAARHDREWNRAIDKLRKIQKERREQSAAPAKRTRPRPNSRVLIDFRLRTRHSPLVTRHSPLNWPLTTGHWPLATERDSPLATEQRYPKNSST